VHITSLHSYPVKSMAGVDAEHLDIDAGGPVGDRRWAVVDARTGAKVTAREVPAMLRVVTRVTTDGVDLETSDGASLAVAYPHDGARVTTDFAQLSHALDAGDEAAAFVSDALGQHLRLVWQAAFADRPSRQNLGGLEGEVLSLADAGPLLLTSESSLSRLQEWVGAETHLEMARFRPNVVIDGDAPFDEDAWDRLRLGGIDFRMQQTCDRCVMTTIHPITLAKGKEPIRTLAQRRKWDGAVWFGVWLAPLAQGRIHVGEVISVEAGCRR